MNTLSSSNRTALILIVLTISIAGFAYAIPAVPVTYEESYQVDVPYDEQEEYTVQVPYTEQEAYYVQVPYTTMEDQQQILVNEEDYTLEGGYYRYRSRFISLGKDVEFYISASNTVNLYVFTSAQYSTYVDGSSISSAPNEKELLEVSQGTLGYHVSATDTYYFCTYNLHSGFLGFGKESVGLYSTKITAYWQEEVTDYRTETRYRDVTKERTETRYRTVSKVRTETHTRDVTIRVTLLEYLSGNYIP